AIAAVLAANGLMPGDRVLLVAENRPEWCIADLAILLAGGITVPTYVTNTVDDHAYILAHSEARIVVCSGPQLARRVLPAVRQTGGVRLALFMDPVEEGAGPGLATLAWSDALAQASTLPAVDHSERLGPDELACFIYTSGTGGRPKGVMLSHRNIMANLRGAASVLEPLGIEEVVFLSFLPLSHAYEHTAGQFLPIALEGQIYYAEGVETLSTNLVEARPAILTCVPRLYEVFRQRMVSTVARQGGLNARLFHKAVELGSRRYRNGGRLSLVDDLLDRALERLVRDKVRARFGGRLKAMVSGGAPLNFEVGLFFTALGLPAAQGYGQTEASPVVSVNPPWRAKLDTVGPPLPGVELAFAGDGEILVRGDLVMKGYWKDEAATAAALADGWLHTGDIGELDGEGYLKITDRKKDIIVLSGGDNVAPQRIEGVLVLEPEIGQAIVLGDRRPAVVALLVPDAEAVKSFAREHGMKPEIAAVAAHESFHKRMAAAVARANARLSPIERIRRFHVLGEPFTVENEMMTPTLKLRRHVIERRHREVLEGLFGT
ncbi:MAG TPA: AMP-binding protein, partial [Geminicoccaceae bacterium]|nr:AMP-binding protein [Geminicoccaceae bacterium]